MIGDHGALHFFNSHFCDLAEAPYLNKYGFHAGADFSSKGEYVDTYGHKCDYLCGVTGHVALRLVQNKTTEEIDRYTATKLLQSKNATSKGPASPELTGVEQLYPHKVMLDAVCNILNITHKLATQLTWQSSFKWAKERGACTRYAATTEIKGQDIAHAIAQILMMDEEKDIDWQHVAIRVPGTKDGVSLPKILHHFSAEKDREHLDLKTGALQFIRDNEIVREIL